MRGKLYFYIVGLLFLLAPSGSFAQQVQTVTITVSDAAANRYSLEPKQTTVKPGKVQFVLVNKAAHNHNIVVKLNGKEVRLVRAVAGQSAKGEPVELAAGEYDIYCNYKTEGGLHKDRGMDGKLIVK